MYSSTRKVLAVTVLGLFICAEVPRFTSAQTREEISARYGAMQSQLQRLDKVPEDIATIKVQIYSIQEAQKAQSERVWYVIMGMLLAVGVKVMEVVFGVKLATREK